MATFTQRRRPAFRRRAPARRNFRRRIVRKRIPRPPSSRAVLFTRYMPDLNFTVTTSDVAGTISINAAEIPGFSEFAVLFQRYKICAIKATFIPLWSSAVTDVNHGRLRMYTAINYTNTGATTLNLLREMKGAKLTPNTVIHKRYLKGPMFSSAIIDNADTTTIAGTRPSKGWLDTDYDDINHYGISYAIESGGASYSMPYKVEVKVFLAFRDPK